MSYLDNSGVSYLWSKIKAAFAAKSHSHAAVDITSGTLPIARGGTGATTAADAVMYIVNGQDIKPKSIKTSGNIESGGNITAADVVEAGVEVYSQGDVVGFDKNGNAHELTKKAEADHKHSADDITSSTLIVARGGTGQSGVSVDSVVANIANANTGCEVTNAQFCQWGKVAQLFLSVKCTAAKSSGNVIAWLYSGKVPYTTSPLMNLSNPSQNCAAYPNGEVQAKGSIPAGTTVNVIGTYLLK